LLLMSCLLLACAAQSAAPERAALAELAPTGALRVAIGVGPVSGPFYTSPGPDGVPRGVTVDLAEALAERLGVPVVFVPFAASRDIQDSADDGVWDVTFMPVDAVRMEIVDFGSAYHLLESTYLVRTESPISSVADADREGVRITGVAETATLRASAGFAPRATHIALTGPDEAVALLEAGGADAIALSRESLAGLAARLPGTRILNDAFLHSTTAIAVPKGRPAARAYASAFIEEAKASGFLRRIFDLHGMAGSRLAPPGMAP
jgi:polar amino acid transport system substrate-binding protein